MTTINRNTAGMNAAKWEKGCRYTQLELEEGLLFCHGHLLAYESRDFNGGSVGVEERVYFNPNSGGTVIFEAIKNGQSYGTPKVLPTYADLFTVELGLTPKRAGIAKLLLDALQTGDYLSIDTWRKK